MHSQRGLQVADLHDGAEVGTEAGDELASMGHRYSMAHSDKVGSSVVALNGLWLPPAATVDYDNVDENHKD